MGKKRVRIGRITKPCEVCQSPVERPASEFREHVFCTKECYWSSDYRSQVVAEANTKRFPVSAVFEKPCEQCGTTVSRSRSQYRNRTFCSAACRQDHRTQNSVRQITSKGYVRVYVGRGRPGADKSGHIPEHRKVMQDFLGRALLPAENVHHINGVRGDNRLENLELWSHSQPSGQRVEDKLAWAREFISLYEDTPML